ncbi:MAG: dihydrofolate reductase family protein [Desertifilum sp.]|nr:dihydrofolate reductase family protein [Desertifilum sp.]
MRKVILYMASSLDGYIARTSGEVDWLFTDDDYGYSEFFATVDTVLMGRLTYEQVLSFGDYPYTGTQGFVFSKTPQSNSSNLVEFINRDPAAFIGELKQQPGKSIWLVGGAGLIQSCFEQIDEFILSIHPIILGEGILLFPPPLSQADLKLQHCQTFDSGLVQLTYSR